MQLKTYPLLNVLQFWMMLFILWHNMHNVTMTVNKLNFLRESFATASESTSNFRVTGISGAASAPSVLSSWWSWSVNNLSTNSMIAVVTDGCVWVRSRRLVIYGNGVRLLFPSACFAKSTKYLKKIIICVISSSCHSVH
jgi:hypothetical protein